MKVFNQIIEKIETYQTIIIHRHQKPDPDALGSQIGLAKLIQQAYPGKKVYTVGESVESLAFIGEMDVIQDEVYQGALVIVTDTANQPRISDKRYNSGDYLIKIDHHPDEDHYGDISYVDTAASSSSEIIASLAFSAKGKLAMNSEAARALYAGIVGDTGRFLYPSTSVKTLQIAAELMKYDFSAAEISQEMNTNPRKIVKLIGYVLQNLFISDSGVAHIIISQELLKSFDLEDSDTAPVVSLPGTIEGVICWGIFVEQENGEYRCRLRSKNPVINEIAKKHNGGGHPLASGANAKDKAELELILQELEAAVSA